MLKGFFIYNKGCLDVAPGVTRQNEALVV